MALLVERERERESTKNRQEGREMQKWTETVQSHSSSLDLYNKEESGRERGEGSR